MPTVITHRYAYVICLQAQAISHTARQEDQSSAGVRVSCVYISRDRWCSCGKTSCCGDKRSLVQLQDPAAACELTPSIAATCLIMSAVAAGVPKSTGAEPPPWPSSVGGGGPASSMVNGSRKPSRLSSSSFSSANVSITCHVAHIPPAICQNRPINHKHLTGRL